MTPKPHSAAARMWPAPAHEVLIRAALGPPDAARAAFATWSERVDIEALDVTSQRLLPLLAGRDDLGPWPRALHQRVRNLERFAWIQTQGRLLRAKPALEAFHAAGVPVMPAKGLAVIVATGLSARVRPMDDIDLTVPVAHSAQAVRLLLDLGLTAPYHLRPEDPGALIDNAGMHLRDHTGQEIDLHANVFDRTLSAAGDEDVWAAATPAELQGVPCVIARREDLVLQAIIHGSPAVSPRAMRWLSDTVLLLRAGAFDWDRLVALARARDAAFVTAGALRVVAELTDVQIPPGVMRARRPLVLERLATHAGSRTAPITRRERLADEVLMWRGRGRPAQLTRGVPARPSPPIAVGQRRSFHDHPEHLTAGFWAYAEAGGLTSDRVAIVDLPLAETAGPLRLTFEVATNLWPDVPTRSVLVFHGARPVARWRFTQPGFHWVTRTVTVPGTRHLRLRLLISNPVAPQLVSDLADHRPQGIALTAVTVTRA